MPRPRGFLRVAAPGDYANAQCNGTERRVVPHPEGPNAGHAWPFVPSPLVRTAEVHA